MGFLAASLAETTAAFVVPALRPAAAAIWLGWLSLRLVNQYGLTLRPGSTSIGSEFATVLLVPGALRAEIRGRALSQVQLTLPAVAAVLGGVALLGMPAGGWVWTAALVPATLGAVLGTSAAYSLLRAAPLGGPGTGAAVLVAVLLQVGLLALLVGPTAAVLLLAPTDAAPAAVVVGVITGTVAATLGIRRAQRYGDAHGPEVLEALRGVPTTVAAQHPVAPAGTASVGDGATATSVGHRPRPLPPR